MICFYAGLLFVCTQLNQPSMDNFFNALESVEGWNPNEPVTNWIGPYQISWEYWKESETEGIYLQCLNRAYARQVMLNNWRLHIPKALENRDYEKLARFHNGGPDGPDQKETLIYWKQVESAMKLNGQ